MTFDWFSYFSLDYFNDGRFSPWIVLLNKTNDQHIDAKSFFHFT